MPDPQPPQGDFASLRRDLHLLATAHAEVSDALGQGLLSTHMANKELMRAVQSLTAVVQVMNEWLDALRWSVTKSASLAARTLLSPAQRDLQHLSVIAIAFAGLRG